MTSKTRFTSFLLSGLVAAVVALTLTQPAEAQGRRAGGVGSSPAAPGGQAVARPSAGPGPGAPQGPGSGSRDRGGAPVQGQAVPRGSVQGPGHPTPYHGYPYYGYPYYGYPYYGYPYYGSYYGYPYYGYPHSYFSFGIGISFGYPYGYGAFSVGWPFYAYSPYPYYTPYWYYPPPGYVPAPSAPENGQPESYPNPNGAVPTGGLRLRVSPDNAKVYVDGALAGTAVDFDGVSDHLDLPRGKHTLELRAEGYETYSNTVEISPGRTITERASLRKR
jgi:hypothetical protein